MIKKLTEPHEITAGLALVDEVFQKFQAPEYSSEGIKNFKDFIAFEQLTPQLNAGKIDLYGYFMENKIVGVLGIKNPNHVCLLFVSDAMHKKGIARSLFKAWLDNHPEIDKVSVNSSDYAYPAYQKLGFSGEYKIIENDGIQFIPMVFTR